MLAFNRHISLPTWEDFINGFSFSSGKMAIIHHSVHFWSVLREYGGCHCFGSWIGVQN